MVDLGVLSRFGPQQDRYSLRTAQVAQMLGGRSEVEAQIEQIMSMEPRVDYDPALFFRRLAPDDSTRRAPLSDRQSKRYLTQVVRGSVSLRQAGSVGADISGALASLARSWGPRAHRARQLSLRGIAEFAKPWLWAHKSEPRVIVVPPELSGRSNG